MAINPMIAMSGQPVNANAAIQGGLQTAQQIRQMPIQAALDKQRVQQGQQQLQMGQQGIQQNTNALQQTKGRYMNQLATALTQLPLEQRAGAVARALPQMQQLGISRDQALSQDLSDQALGQVIAATRPFVQTPGSDQTAGMKDFQFYQSVINDPNSTPEQKRSARIALGLEANEGRTQLIDTGVPGVYQTFDANTNQMSVPLKRDDQGNLVPLTREEQLELNLNEEGRRIRTRGDAETDVQADRINRLTDEEVEREIALVTARAEASDAVQTRIEQTGQMSKLEDADTAYKALKTGDLAKIYGRGESLFPDFLRSQEGINLMAHREQLIGMITMAARGELAGQGTITDNEVETLQQAATILANENISPQLAERQLDAAMNILYGNAGQEFNPDESADDSVNNWLDQQFSQ